MLFISILSSSFLVTGYIICRYIMTMNIRIYMNIQLNMPLFMTPRAFQGGSNWGCLSRSTKCEFYFWWKKTCWAVKIGRLSHTLQGFYIYICFYTSQLLCRTVNLPQYACHTQCFEGRSMAVPPFSTLAHGQLHICSNHSIATFPPMTTSTTQLHDSPHAVIPLRDATRHALRANFRILSSRESDVTFLPLWLHWDGWSPGFSLLWLSKESSRLAKCECEKRQGLGGMAKLGQRLKQKKNNFYQQGKHE